MCDNGTKISFRETQTIFSIAQFGKYLPGNVGQHLGRVVMAREAGIPLPVILSTMLVEMLWGVGIGLGLALLGLFLLGTDQAAMARIHFSPVLLALATILIFTVPWLSIWLLNRHSSRTVARLTGSATLPLSKLRTAMIVAALLLLAFIITGSVLKLQAVYLFGVNQSTPFELACLFSFAWLAGYFYARCAGRGRNEGSGHGARPVADPWRRLRCGAGDKPEDYNDAG